MKKLLFAILFGLSLLPVLSVTAPSAQAREVVVREHRGSHAGGYHYRHHYQRHYRHSYSHHRSYRQHYRHHRSGGVSVSIQ